MFIRKNNKEYITRYYTRDTTAWAQPTLSSNGTAGTSSTAVWASTYYNSTYAPYKAMDNSTSTRWSTSSAEQYTGTFYLYTDTAYVLKSVTFTNSNTNPDRAAGTVTIYGSIDNNTWVKLASYTNSNTTKSATWTVDIDTDYLTSYNYHKLDFAQETEYVEFSEFDFEMYPAAVEVEQEEYDTFEGEKFIKYYTQTIEADGTITEKEIPLPPPKYRYNTIYHNNKGYFPTTKTATYLNFVPWVVPFMEYNGEMFNLTSANNYTINQKGNSPLAFTTGSTTYTPYTDVAAVTEAYKLFRDSATIDTTDSNELVAYMGATKAGEKITTDYYVYTSPIAAYGVNGSVNNGSPTASYSYIKENVLGKDIQFKVVYFSPCPIHLETVSAYWGGVKSVDVYGSNDGSTGTLLLSFEPPLSLGAVRNNHEAARLHYGLSETDLKDSISNDTDIVSLVNNQSSLSNETAKSMDTVTRYYGGVNSTDTVVASAGNSGAYGIERTSYYISSEDTQMYCYHTLIFHLNTDVLNYNIQATSSYIYDEMYWWFPGLAVRSLILAGKILDNTDWTDNETYEWSLPRLSDDYCKIGQLIYSDDTNGNIAVSASSGAAVAVPILDKDSDLRSTSFTINDKYNTFCATSAADYRSFDWTYGWCPDVVTGQIEGQWCLHLPYKIKISGIDVTLTVYRTALQQSSGENYSAYPETIQFFADVGCTVPISTPYTISTDYNNKHQITLHFDHSNDPVSTETLVYKITGTEGQASIATHLTYVDPTAVKLSLTEADSATAKFLVSSQGALPANKKKSSKWWVTAIGVVASIAIAIVGTVTGQAWLYSVASMTATGTGLISTGD